VLFIKKKKKNSIQIGSVETSESLDGNLLLITAINKKKSITVKTSNPTLSHNKIKT